MLRDLILYSGRPTNGGRNLRNRLDCRYLRDVNRRRLARLDGSLVINWGNTTIPEWLVSNRSILVNKPEAIALATSKVRSYEKFREAGVPTITHTHDGGEAHQWLRDGERVLVRRDGLSGGRGIVIRDAATDGEFHLGGGVFAAKYFKKTHEYRAHVYKGRVIDITQKKRTTNNGADGDGVDGNTRTVYQRVVRSHENGWVHAHEDLHLPGETRTTLGDAAIAACQALGLDFGAVDLLVRFSKRDPNNMLGYAVCEVNTAPGLENNDTLEAYKQAILSHYEETKDVRHVPRPPRRVLRPVLVWITTKKGNRVQRMRNRYVHV